MTDTSTLTKSNPFSLENRFESDYEVLEEIGSGGFSTVYKVRNQLDHSLYAIKKIIINISKANKKSIQKELDSVLQEIRLLARSKSEHVINYNHSWIEVKLKKLQSPKLSDESVTESLFESSSTDGIIEFIDSSRKNSDQSTDATETAHKTETISLNNQEYNIDEISHLVLYIQMELCKGTLHDVLEKRNSSIKYEKVENFLKENEREVLEMFKSMFCDRLCPFCGKIYPQRFKTKQYLPHGRRKSQNWRLRTCN
jgi:serine/threonine protein kinase